MSFSEMAARKAKAEQGKTAEAKVGKLLGDIDSRVVDFDWHRGYDARAAGGKFQRVAGDFSFYSPQGHGIFEVKEVALPHRLPYGNFELSQVGKAVKRELAGGLVRVLFYSSVLDTWRILPISLFQHRDKSVGSWFLEDQWQYPNLQAALQTLPYFLPLL